MQNENSKKQIANILEAYITKNAPVKRSELNTTFASLKEIVDEVLAGLPPESVEEDVTA